MAQKCENLLERTLVSLIGVCDEGKWVGMRVCARGRRPPPPFSPSFWSIAPTGPSHSRFAGRCCFYCFHSASQPSSASCSSNHPPERESEHANDKCVEVKVSCEVGNSEWGVNFTLRTQIIGGHNYYDCVRSALHPDKQYTRVPIAESLTAKQCPSPEPWFPLVRPLPPTPIYSA